MIDSGLDSAYRATTYQLTVNGQQLPVRVGEPASELALHLAQIGAKRWAFLTAWNPRSEMLTGPENARLNAQLFQQLVGKNYSPAIALPDDNSWPREPGFVIFDMPMPELLSLAEQFQQHAIVVGQGGDIPELLWVAGSSE